MPQENKIKVLQCIRQGQIGGGESHLLSLIENMDQSIYEPIVLSFTDGPMLDRLKSLSIKSHIIHTEKPFDISKWNTVKKLMVRERIDLVHAHGTRANSNVFWAARALKIPVVYTIHGWSFHLDQNPLVKLIRTQGEKLLTSKSSVNIAVSSSNRQTGIDHIKGLEAVVINNGIDQTRFSPARNYKNIRNELGINSNDLLLLFIARFTSHKQPLALINAFAKALKAIPELKLLMVGEGDERKKAGMLLKELGIEKSVILIDFRHDVPDILAGADIFILPSLWEGLPIGILEAMSMGKAIIATNVDGTCEVIENEENGLLIELTNLEQNLSEAIVRLALDPVLRKKFGLNAMETVNSRFNAEVMTREIEKVYINLTQKKIKIPNGIQQDS